MRRLALIALLAAGAVLSIAFTGAAGAPGTGAATAAGIISGPPAEIPPAQPVAMTRTSRALLAFCRRNRLLRSICPRRLPAWGSAPPGQQGYYCQTRNPHETERESVRSFGSNRCVFAEWSYENGEGLRAWTAGTRVSGWDGQNWVADEWSMFSPPVHVGIDIQALLDSPRDRNLSLVPDQGRAAWPEGRHRVNDALLSPARTVAVSLGWVRWYRKYGQLVLTTYGTCGLGDRLIFYVPPHARSVGYAITLDAWMPAVRLVGKRVDRVIRFQSGPALPHVIATLKAIVGSALGQGAG